MGWIEKRNDIQTDTQSNGWRTVGVYFYGPDGRYSPATWAETPQRFVEMVPQIRMHLDNKLEVRITSSDDLCFSMRQKTALNGTEYVCRNTCRGNHNATARQRLETIRRRKNTLSLCRGRWTTILNVSGLSSA
jgi:hypothetical protein